MNALIISADGFEDLELFYPMYRLKEEGFDVALAAPYVTEIKGKHGYAVKPDMTLSRVQPDDYDLLVIPGGKAPARLRADKDALAIAARFMEARKPVAAICHGPQVLAAAGLVKGRTATCWHKIRDELVAAGAWYTDSPVVVDGGLITSRMPDDLPDFMRETLKAVRAGMERMAA